MAHSLRPLVNGLRQLVARRAVALQRASDAARRGDLAEAGSQRQASLQAEVEIMQRVIAMDAHADLARIELILAEFEASMPEVARA